ncbi:MAG: hypothetical protein HC907_14945 [Richelia sp. SM1_7_0]|nr:hypothetical protein [Richelia sp. SM1_7_0]
MGNSDNHTDEIFNQTEVLKQRDDDATLIKVYVTPQEHQILKELAKNRGGLSHMVRCLLIQWMNQP